MDDRSQGCRANRDGMARPDASSPRVHKRRCAYPSRSRRRHVARAAAALDEPLCFTPSARLMKEAGLLVDWPAGLQARAPRLAGKLRSLTFEQGIAMSHRWHEHLR